MNQNLWTVSTQDFFTKKMLTYAFVPFLFTLVVLYALFFSAADAGLDNLQDSFVQIESTQTTQENGITHTENTNVVYSGGSAILEFLMQYSITSWLVSFFVFTVGGMFMFVVAIFTAILVIGFLTPAIMKELQARHYPKIEMEGHGNVMTTLFHSLKYVAITFILLIVLIPFYFIPLINIVAINLPFYYLFHKFYMLDVGTTALTREQYKQMMYFKGNNVRTTTVILYVISMIPFAALITPVFNVIVLSHTVFRNKQAQLDAPTQP
ncbi:MAG: EI24 domain-containing protein [Sulfurimonadaceae bacterium]